MRIARRHFWVIGILGAAALSFIVAWAMLGSDTLPKSKASFFAMTQALSPAREAASKCWSEGHVVAANCNTMKDRMPVPPSPDVAYLVTDQGAVMGIDYPNRVVVMLTSHADGNELKWHCTGIPSEALPKLCSELMAVKREK